MSEGWLIHVATIALIISLTERKHKDKTGGRENAALIWVVDAGRIDFKPRTPMMNVDFEAPAKNMNIEKPACPWMLTGCCDMTYV